MAFSLAGRLGLATTTALLRSPAAAAASPLRLLCTASAADKISKLVKEDKVVVFMKGVPENPRCGFSNAVVQVLRMHGVDYSAHDVLEDEALRQGIKDFSNWPTIPQVYIDGQFVGGCDILLQMHQNGELVDELAKVGIKSLLVDAASSAEGSTDEKQEKR
uniref:Glutaredoxin-related protein 5, mitochondrial n=1 Tax=Amblyomma maculatum TaxID=34609 RepID=G3MKX1_AMBMU